MKTLPPVAIHNKYDLMHRNTPGYASTVITWDTAKMGSITKKRVIEWLKTGTAKYQRGEAASMYHQIRKRFGLPNFTVTPCTQSKSGHWNPNGYIKWENASDSLMHAINEVYQAERVIRRMSDKHGHGLPWYLQEDAKKKDKDYFYIETLHDLTKINAEIAKIMASDEVAYKRDEAVAFIEEGGTFTFTYGV